MKKELLLSIIADRDPIESAAVGAMIDFVTDNWSGTFPTKEQTTAVNAYLRQIPTCEHSDTETNCEHRRIASQRLTIDAINVLDKAQLDRMQNVLDKIAYDEDYYMAERNRGLGR